MKRPGLHPGFFIGFAVLYIRHEILDKPLSMTTQEHNPYTPPSSRVEEPEQGGKRKAAPLKGLLAGLAVDIGGTLCLGVLISFVYGVVGTVSGQTVEQITAYLSHIPHDSWLYIGSTAAGCALSFLGGYVGARIAQRSEYQVGAIQAVLSVALGLWMGSKDMSFGMQISLSGLTALLIMLGVRVGIQRNRRTNGAKTQSA